MEAEGRTPVELVVPYIASTLDLRARRYPKLHHSAVIVRDIDETIRQTLESLQLPLSAIMLNMVIEVADGLYNGIPASFSSRFVMIEIGNMMLEYIQPLGDAPSPYQDAIAGGADDVAHHIAFLVPDVEQHLAEVRNRNPSIQIVLDVVDGPMRYVYVDGILPGQLVELIDDGGLAAVQAANEA